MNSKLITRPGQRRVDFAATPQSEDAPPGVWATVMFALVTAVAVTAFIALVVSAGYAIALHGLSPG